MTALFLCPDEDRLLGMLDCELDQLQQGEVTDHVNECVTCQSRLETLVTRGLREDLEFDHVATHLRDGLRDIDFSFSTDDIGKMTETLLSADAQHTGPIISLDFLQPSDVPDSLGRLGQYEITEVIGRGGMGIALKARDTRLDRIVAVKVLAPELASNPTARKRFLREAKAAAAVSHDHVVTVHAVEPADLPYLAMEYIDGYSLQQRIDREGPLPVQEILRISLQTARGLAAAHGQGLIHHDIKPANILLQNGIERVQITDFGLARAVDDVTITRIGEVRGTPQYMSPEQARGESTDPRSDLFSLGAAMYTMCTGRAPFRGSSTMGVLHRVCNDKPREIREINPEVPEWLIRIINRLLEKNREDRFQTAEEVADLLEQCLAHLQQPTVVPLPELAGPSTKTQPSRRKWNAGAIVALVLLGGLGMSEATGVTRLAGTVLRITLGEGTLLIEVDDPTVEVSLDGEELSISGAGIQELKLRPGQYRFKATKDGQPIEQKLVTITRGDRQVVSISRKPSPSRVDIGHDTSQRDYVSLPKGAITQVKQFVRPDTKAAVSELIFSPDGKELLCGRDAYFLEAWNVASSQHSVVKDTGGRLSVSQRESTLATAHFEHDHVMLWDLASLRKTGDLIPREPASDHGYLQVDLSPNGRHVVAAGHDGVARLWDVESGAQTHSFGAFDDKCLVARFAPDSQRVLVGFAPLRLIDIATSDEVWQIADAIALDAAFSPSGQWLVYVSAYTLVLVDAETGAEVRRFEGHSDSIRSIQFLPDSRHCISGSEDRTIRVWSIATGREIARVTTETHVTNQIAVSPDGRHVASGGGRFKNDGVVNKDGDNSIRLWQLPESVWGNKSASVEKNAFVVLGGDGVEIAKVDTLADAVLNSNPGDTIEIRGNGPFVTVPIEVEHPLAIHGAEGYRPVVRGTYRHGGPLIRGNSILALENLELHRTATENEPSPICAIRSYAPLRATNCRIVVDDFGCAVSSTNACSLKNCQLIVAKGSAFSHDYQRAEKSVDLENCVVCGVVSPSLVMYTPDTKVGLRLKSNTLCSRGLGVIQFTPLPHIVVSEQADRPARPFRVQASGNIFDHPRNIFTFRKETTEVSYDFDDAKSWLPRFIDWQEKGNLYASPAGFLNYLVEGATALHYPDSPIKTLEHWNQYWGLHDTGSSQGIIRYVSGNVSARFRESPESVTANDFRLRPDSAGYQSGPNGEDLGANIDLVGPGEAYERWKETPEYQQWQKETRELMESAQTNHPPTNAPKLLVRRAISFLLWHPSPPNLFAGEGPGVRGQSIRR